MGLWGGYGGWLLSGRFAQTPYALVKDLAAVPELRWLNRHWLVPPALLGLAVCVAGGGEAFALGFCLSSALLRHGLGLADALAHRLGRRRYATPDASRNSLLVALLFLGEGWHNNPHHGPASARQGFFWWEVDLTDTLLRGMARVGRVWGLRTPSGAVRRRNRRGRGEAAGTSTGARVTPRSPAAR